MAEKKIGTRTFRADKLPATQGVSLMFRLGKIVGPALGQLATISTAAKGDKADQREHVLTVVGELFGRLEPTTAQALLVELCEKSQVQMPQGNYEPVIFDPVFEGNVMDAFQVAAFVVQVNFGDFLDAGLLDG